MVSTIFETIGILAVALGGLLAAFSAQKPTRLFSWASAYLVLIVGLTQYGLASGYNRLGASSDVLAFLAFIIFNIGNLLILGGTGRRHSRNDPGQFVNIGGALLALAMVLLVLAINNYRFSWTLVGFLVLAVIVLVSMPIGLVLSARRRVKPVKKPSKI